jgi:hypothetical protein
MASTITRPISPLVSLSTHHSLNSFLPPRRHPSVNDLAAVLLNFSDLFLQKSRWSTDAPYIDPVTCTKSHSVPHSNEKKILK